MKTKLNELLRFPCLFTYKVLGISSPYLFDSVIKVVNKYTRGDYSTKTKTSKKGNYYSISITIIALNIEQIETLYRELNKINIVRIVL